MCWKICSGRAKLTTSSRIKRTNCSRLISATMWLNQLKPCWLPDTRSCTEGKGFRYGACSLAFRKGSGKLSTKVCPECQWLKWGDQDWLFCPDSEWLGSPDANNAYFLLRFGFQLNNFVTSLLLFRGRPKRPSRNHVFCLQKSDPSPL